jgi:hypothetical protein
MRKIRLDLEALEVDSFAISADGDDDRGTVHARASLRLCTGADTCAGEPTCLGDATCASACSETDGYAYCKTAGPCCYE